MAGSRQSLDLRLAAAQTLWDLLQELLKRQHQRDKATPTSDEAGSAGDEDIAVDSSPIEVKLGSDEEVKPTPFSPEGVRALLSRVSRGQPYHRMAALSSLFSPSTAPPTPLGHDQQKLPVASPLIPTSRTNTASCEPLAVSIDELLALPGLAKV